MRPSVTRRCGILAAPAISLAVAISCIAERHATPQQDSIKSIVLQPVSFHDVSTGVLGESLAQRLAPAACRPSSDDSCDRLYSDQRRRYVLLERCSHDGSTRGRLELIRLGSATEVTKLQCSSGEFDRFLEWYCTEGCNEPGLCFYQLHLAPSPRIRWQLKMLYDVNLQRGEWLVTVNDNGTTTCTERWTETEP